MTDTRTLEILKNQDMIKFRYVNMNFRYKMHEIYKEALIISHQYLTISLNDDGNFKMKEEKFYPRRKKQVQIFPLLVCP